MTVTAWPVSSTSVRVPVAVTVIVVSSVRERRRRFPPSHPAQALESKRSNYKETDIYAQNLPPLANTTLVAGRLFASRPTLAPVHPARRENDVTRTGLLARRIAASHRLPG